MTKKTTNKKIFVLDTSVLLFDSTAVNNFTDNDVAIPITVLEELDNFKIGNDTKNFEAREVIRFLDKLSGEHGLTSWINIAPGKGNIKIVMPRALLGLNAETIYGSEKNDHKIINAALSLKETEKETNVILVTKDINLRLKAKALGLKAEDYETGKVKNVKNISEGFPLIEVEDVKVLPRLYKDDFIDEDGILGDAKIPNGYYILSQNQKTILVRYNDLTDNIEHVEKQYAYGIKPRNAEQSFAINALLNDEIKLVALQGVAGTGKTLLALAAALEQNKKYEQIILTRPIIPLSNRDIGFLPGNEEDKISPYMQPLWDNLKFIKSQFRENERKKVVIDEMERNGQLSIIALAFIRGRTLANSIIIVDEAQNLTPIEIKTIITRAGEGSKIVFTGDINQIDTPYMDEQSNGLTYLIDRLKGHHLFSHIKLEKGERSALANLANDLL